MSPQKLIPHALAFVFTFSLAGTAFARRPAALVTAQERADRVVSTCPDSAAPSTAGYRDMLARVQHQRSAGTAVAALPLAPARKMGNHIVLVCSGGEVHQGSGYRDFPARMPVKAEKVEIARSQVFWTTAAR
jgi:hypothetical protein